MSRALTETADLLRPDNPLQQVAADRWTIARPALREKVREALPRKSRAADAVRPQKYRAAATPRQEAAAPPVRNRAMATTPTHAAVRAGRVREEDKEFLDSNYKQRLSQK